MTLLSIFSSILLFPIRFLVVPSSSIWPWNWDRDMAEAMEEEKHEYSLELLNDWLEEPWELSTEEKTLLEDLLQGSENYLPSRGG